MKKTIFLLLVIFGLLVYISKHTCNKKGTLAHKLNWAGHNCVEQIQGEILEQ